MRNLKRALSLGLTATMLSSLMVAGAGAASYADVTSKNNEEAIDVLKAVGVMTGDENGKFNPDQNVTRAEMATVMAQMLDLDVDNFDVSNIPFTDVPTWAAPYVAACYADGITSGTSATTYSPNDSVTTVQAALMMLKALGYFQYASDFGSDWTLATMKQASKIDLFSDITASSKQAMNRDEVAQLALNTLKATMVEADKTGNDVIIGDIVIGGNVKYEDVTSSSKHAEAFGDKAIDNNSKKYTVELGEKLFNGDLEKAGVSDDFGRPATKWSYKLAEVGTYEDEADAAYTGEVKAKELYVDLDLDKDTNATVYLDGVKQSDFSVKKGDSTILPNSQNGMVTEAYVDKDENVVIALHKVLYGEVTKVTPAKGKEKATINVSNSGGLTFEAEGYKVDDKVFFTKANNEIQSVGLATKVEGLTVTKVTNSSMEANGTEYKFNKAADAVNNFIGDVTVDSILDIYTDNNGYIIDVEVSKASRDYAYVIGYHQDNYDSSEYTAKLLMADGTVSVVQLDETNMSGVVSSFDHNAVEFTKNSKDEYTLIKTSSSGLSTATTVEVNKGESAMKLGSTTYYGNEKTIYLVKESNGNYVSYVGYANVPDMDAAAGKYAVYTTGSSNLAKVVYLEDVATRSDDIVYVLGSKDGKKITDTKAGTFYEYKAVVNGEITTVRMNNNSIDGTDRLYNSIAYSDKEYNILDVAACQAYSTTDKDNYAIKNATVANVKKDGVLDLGVKGTYAIGKDVKVFAIYGGDRIETAGISDIEAGDTVDLIIKNGEIISAFYGETDAGNTGGIAGDHAVKAGTVVVNSNKTVSFQIKTNNNTGAALNYKVEIQMFNNETATWVTLDTVDATVNTGSDTGTTATIGAMATGRTYRAVVGGVTSPAQAI